MPYPDGLHWNFTGKEARWHLEGGLELPKEMILERNVPGYPINKKVSLDVVKITLLGLQGEAAKAQPFFSKNDFYDFEFGASDFLYEITTSDGSKFSVIRTYRLGLIKIEEFLETEINQHCALAENPQNVVVGKNSICACKNDDDKENHKKRLDAQKDAIRNRWHMIQPVLSFPR